MPEGSVIVVSGPRPVAEAGVVDAHDHLRCGSPRIPADALREQPASACALLEPLTVGSAA